jgi:hypothetical protein
MMPRPIGGGRRHAANQTSFPPTQAAPSHGRRRFFVFGALTTWIANTLDRRLRRGSDRYRLPKTWKPATSQAMYVFFFLPDK